VAYHPGEKRPVGPHGKDKVGIGLEGRFPSSPVSFVVVLAARMLP